MAFVIFSPVSNSSNHPLVVILSFQELKDTGITFMCISLDSNDDSVMRLVNVFCFPFHSAPTAKIYPRELIASSRGVRINLQKVPLFGHFGPKMLMGWAAWPARYGLCSAHDYHQSIIS